VCGFPEEEAKAPAAAEAGEEAEPSQAQALLSRAEKEIIGAQCKELLDVGRALWLQQRGFDVRLVRYVAPDVSPENTLLIATRAPSPSPSLSLA
jgi:tRNA:m4X modification enzyme